MNVKEHAFVPEHQALTTEEKKAMLERYTVKENQVSCYETSFYCQISVVLFFSYS